MQRQKRSRIREEESTNGGRALSPTSINEGKLKDAKLCNSRVTEDLERLKESVGDLLTQTASLAGETRSLVPSLLGSQLLVELMNNLRALHNRVLCSDFFVQNLPRKIFEENLKSLLLEEKIDVNLNISRFFFDADERREDSGYPRVAGRNLTRLDTSDALSQNEHSVATTPKNPLPKDAPFCPLGNPGQNKFSALSSLFSQGLITLEERSRIKNFILQDDCKVLKAFREFARSGNHADLAHALKDRLIETQSLRLK